MDLEFVQFYLNMWFMVELGHTYLGLKVWGKQNVLSFLHLPERSVNMMGYIIVRRLPILSKLTLNCQIDIYSRWWPTNIHTIRMRDTDRWCHKWLMCSAPQTQVFYCYALNLLPTKKMLTLFCVTIDGKTIKNEIACKNYIVGKRPWNQRRF